MKFTKTQIVAILKQADASIPVKDICRQAGISGATYYSWKSKYGGLDASELRRDQNAYIERFNRTFREEVLDPSSPSSTGSIRPILDQMTNPTFSPRRS